MKSRNAMMTTLILGFVLLLATPLTQAAGTVFVQLGNIEGDSRDKGHEGWIDVEAFSQAVAIAGTQHAGGGSGTGKADFQDITLVKRLDVASLGIWFAALRGDSLEVTIDFVRYLDKPETYFKVQLSDARIASVEQETEEGGEILEKVRLVFSRIEITYKSFDGPNAGHEVSARWDLEQNSSY